MASTEEVLKKEYDDAVAEVNRALLQLQFLMDKREKVMEKARENNPDVIIIELFPTARADASDFRKILTASVALGERHGPDWYQG